jgi:hypothetical protein
MSKAGHSSRDRTQAPLISAGATHCSLTNTLSLAHRELSQARSLPLRAHHTQRSAHTVTCSTRSHARCMHKHVSHRDDTFDRCTGVYRCESRHAHGAMRKITRRMHPQVDPLTHTPQCPCGITTFRTSRTQDSHNLATVRRVGFMLPVQTQPPVATHRGPHFPSLYMSSHAM